MSLGIEDQSSTYRVSKMIEVLRWRCLGHTLRRQGSMPYTSLEREVDDLSPERREVWRPLISFAAQNSVFV